MDCVFVCSTKQREFRQRTRKIDIERQRDLAWIVYSDLFIALMIMMMNRESVGREQERQKDIEFNFTCCPKAKKAKDREKEFE